MFKKITSILMTATLICCLTACAGSSSSDSSDTTTAKDNSSNTSEEVTSDTTETKSSSNTSTELSDDEYFADGDFKDVEGETPDATITLSGTTGTISDTTRGSSGNEVTITSKGIYRVSGSSEDVSIIINDDNESGNIYLVLDNVEMKNTSSACICVEACDKLVIQNVGDNSLAYTNSSSDSSIDGAIYAKDDITINGSGNLTIDSGLHGIVCKNDMKITGANLTINSGSIGIKAGDSLRIGGGTVAITSGHDGVQVTNKSGDSYLYFKDGSLTIDSQYDGIAVVSDADSFEGYIKLLSGSIDITAGNGASNSKSSETSQKGVKCDGNIYIDEVELAVSSADDAIHGNADVVVTSGKLNLATSDDGISAYSLLSISDGEINVTKSYEGLEACDIEISGGDISIYSSDDGINTAGGSDTTSTEVNPWEASTDATLTISGGNIYVNASGDGLDSNGSLYVTGGTVIVEGPTGNDNGALDIGDGSDCVASITGGVVLAIGSTGMAVNFDSGTQCSALVTLSGSSGTEIAVSDGSGFSFTATKDFACAVYSSPDMAQGNTYDITAGSQSNTMDFSSSLYYTDVAGGMGGMGGMGGGQRGDMGGQRR